MIYRQTVYCNEANEKLIGLTDISDPLIPERFVAEVAFSFMVDREQINAQARVNIPGATIEEAFANTQAAVKNAQQQMLAEIVKQRQSRIIVPNLVAQNGQAHPRMRLTE